MTAISSTWGNGELGPLGICVATGQVRPSLITDINAAYHGHVFIFESGTESHFMNAETTLLYLRNLIGPATLSKDSDHIYIYVYICIYICI